MDKKHKLHELCEIVCWKCARFDTLYYPRKTPTATRTWENHDFHHDGVRCEAAKLYDAGFWAGIEVGGTNHIEPAKK